VSTVELTEDDMRTIIDTHIYDGTVEEEMDDDGNDMYREAVLKPYNTSALGSIPCGVCPLVHLCSDSGPISPAKCEYSQQWLQF